MDNNEVDKTKSAVAISYDRDSDNAPKVIAKGKGYIADKIIKAAKQNSVPIYQNKTLSSMLMAIELDREIPPELYQVVAEMLAYIYYIDQKIGKKDK